MKGFASLIVTTALFVVAIVVLLTCVKRKDTSMINERSRSVEQVFDSHRDSLLSIPGVVGAGIAMLENKPCIMVMVQRKADIVPGQIPQELDGYNVVVEETSRLAPQGAP
jgi:hypothetical protein